MKNLFKNLFKKKPKATNRILTKISPPKGAWATLDTPPPQGLSYLEIGQPVSFAPASVLIEVKDKRKGRFFRVVTNYIELKDEAPHGCIVSFTEKEFSNLKYKKI